MVPALAWVPSLAGSLSRALGCAVEHATQVGVNPLLHTIVFKFGQEQDGKARMQIWNLIQLYMTKNDAFPQGSPSLEPSKFVIKVGVKTRRGPARDDAPWR